MKSWKIVVGLVGCWLVIMVYMSNSVMQSGEANQMTELKLKRAVEEMERLKSQNEELQKLAVDLKDLQSNQAGKKPDGSDTLEKLKQKLELAKQQLKELTADNPQVFKMKALSDDGGGGGGSFQPSLNHESNRRKLENTNREFWFYIHSELKKIRNLVGETSFAKTKVDNVIKTAKEYQKTLYVDSVKLQDVDGAGEWRKKELQDLGDLVQKRLAYLQNPSDCSQARKIVCNLHKGCGYGCQLHHVVYCFIVSYATQRTLILESKGWRYASQGWESVFLPLSKTCKERSGSVSKHWGPPNMIENAQVVELPIVDSMHPRPDFMPLAVPADLADRLSRVHGDPAVWWIGQFVKYLTRPQPVLQDDMDKTKSKLGFQNPIVGVHVRRTDKVGVEAAFHSIEEYMTHVEEYYDKRERVERIDKRRVYLATDDSALLEEAKRKYRNYTFISDNQVSKTAGLGTRYTDASLRGVVLDIHFLSISDYLVCTFSSQVCRVAYEIMQTLRSDAAFNFYSLDDVYYFGGQNAHNMVALEPHKSQNAKEMDLEVGDLVGIAGNHWDGYSKGTNRRTGKSALYPSYKVENKVRVAEMPTYKEVDGLS